MSIRPIAMSLCAVMVLSACTSGKTSKSMAGVNADTYVFTTKHASVSLAKADMEIYIASAENQLMLLEQQETNRCIQGQLAIAQAHLTRATSEHYANMHKDAFITLVDFDRQVRKIHCINGYIKDQLGCGYTYKKAVLKRWYDEGDFDQCHNPSIANKANIEVLPVKNVALEEAKKALVENTHNHMIITETLHDFNEDQIKPIYYPSLDKLIELI